MGSSERKFTNVDAQMRTITSYMLSKQLCHSNDGLTTSIKLIFIPNMPLVMKAELLILHTLSLGLPTPQ